MRDNFKRFSSEEILKFQNNVVLQQLSYHKKREVADSMVGSVYHVVSDDQDMNILKTSYECTLLAPYEEAGKFHYFRYYFSWDVAAINSFEHQDQRCRSFFLFPLRRRVDIQSDAKIDWNAEVVKRNTNVENAYFSFSNTKTPIPGGVRVAAVFTPKTAGWIQREDLDNFKKDIARMSDNNFGVGIKYLSQMQYLLSRWYILALFYLIFFGILMMIAYFIQTR